MVDPLSLSGGSLILCVLDATLPSAWEGRGMGDHGASVTGQPRPLLGVFNCGKKEREEQGGSGRITALHGQQHSKFMTPHTKYIETAMNFHMISV